jgi:phage shock protein PspC (stress-responsive transcriptional regulator)
MEQYEPTEQQPQQPRRLMRSEQDRMIAGVCGGLGRYFGIDPVIFRIATLALVFAGGAGVLMYLAAWILIPSGDDPALAAASPAGAAPADRNRWLIVALVVVGLILAIPVLLIAGFLLPFLFLGLIGVGLWWLISGRRPEGGGDVARAALLGVGVLLLLSAVFVGAGWAAAAGSGEVVAGLVIAAGTLLVGAAFVGGARWLILPALAIAFPLAVVSATGLDLDGGVGDRNYRPGSVADIRNHYKLGAGSMRIDLRDVKFSDGDVPMKVDVGMGEAVLIVPPQVCVATRAHVGIGEVKVFDRDNAGVDVDLQDTRTAADGHPRIVLDADLGIGSLQVRHSDFYPFSESLRSGRVGPAPLDGFDPGTNAACTGAAS